MNKIKRLFLCALVSLIALSCAVESTDNTDYGYESFYQWIQKNAPEADSLPGGVYIEFKKRAADFESLPAPTLDTSWLRMSYTGHLLNGNVFELRDSITAQFQGTWAIDVRYVDDYVLYTKSQKLCLGLIVALDSMRAGDEARIYIPSYLAYSTSMDENSGYAGSEYSYTNYPIYFDLSLKSIENEPLESEFDRLNKWVAENWGMTEADTLSKGLYMRITEPNPEGDTITKDSIESYDYIIRFMDGQLQSTTLKDVAVEAGYDKGTGTTTYYQKDITTSGFNDTLGVNNVFPRVILQMRAGETAEVAAVAAYGVGMQGATTETPQILPYESMRYTIMVHDEEEEEDKEE